MSFLDKLFKRKPTPVIKEKAPVEPEQRKEINIRSRVLGNVAASKIDITVQNITDIQKRFIAFDVETTGLTPEVDM